MKKKLLTAMCCMFLLAGCQQAEEIKSNNEMLRMSIEASIGKDGKVAGRTVLGDEGVVSFVDDDAIGMSVNGGEFVKWTYDEDENTWGLDEGVTPLYWEDKTTPHKFCAFYPFVSGATLASVTMPDLTKQKGLKEELGIYDFLVATKEQSFGTDGVVSFSGDHAFEHASSLIVVTLKGEGDLVSTDENEVIINEISISGDNIATASTCVFGDNGPTVVLASGEEKKVDLLQVSMEDFELSSDGATFYFVVNAGTVNLKDVSLSIMYASGDNEYVATLAGMEDEEQDDITKFESGKQYSYALKVVGGEIVVSGNGINEWDEVIDLDDIIINGVEQ